MKKYIAPRIEVTKIEMETAILAASVESKYMDGEIQESKDILSNKNNFFQYLEDENEL
mgnify:CR=1 FL=1